MNKYVKMAQREETEPLLINMLLDPKSFHGGHESPLGPFLIALCIGVLPILLYVYFQLFLYIPIWVFVIFCIIWIMRVIMIFPGKEKQRVAAFKRRLQEKYTDTASLVRIKTIHEDGCVEYVNGTVKYLVVGYNGSFEDDQQHARSMNKFLQNLVGKFDFDVHIYNITDLEALDEYYDKTSAFGKNDAAVNFIKMIDYSKDLVSKNSLVQAIVISITGRRSDWKNIKTQIVKALESRDARVFKSIKLCDNTRVVGAIIDRDIGTNVNINNLLRERYKTSEYMSSKVIKYDVDESTPMKLNDVSEIKPVIPTPKSKATFHRKFQEGTNNENKTMPTLRPGINNSSSYAGNGEE